MVYWAVQKNKMLTRKRHVGPLKETLTAVWVVGQLHVWRFSHQNFGQSLSIVNRKWNLHYRYETHMRNVFMVKRNIYLFVSPNFAFDLRVSRNSLVLLSNKMDFALNPVDKYVVYTTETTLLVF